MDGQDGFLRLMGLEHNVVGSRRGQLGDGRGWG